MLLALKVGSVASGVAIQELAFSLSYVGVGEAGLEGLLRELLG